MMILAMIMIFKCLLSAIDFATRYSTRYSDFLSQPYSNPTRSQITLLAGACSCPVYPFKRGTGGRSRSRSRVEQKGNSDVSTRFVLLHNEPFQEIHSWQIHLKKSTLKKYSLEWYCLKNTPRKILDSDISTGFVRPLPNEPDCALFTNTITRASIQTADVKSNVMK